MEGLGSSKAVFDCPHCGVSNCMQLQVYAISKAYVTNRLVTANDGAKTWDTRHYSHHIYRCASERCQGDTYFLLMSSPQEVEVSTTGSPPRVAPARPPRIAHQFPVATPVDHESVPAEVKNAAGEAEKCLAVRAYSACGTMTRRAVDAISQDKGAQGRDLYDRLAYLNDNRIITPDLWEWAEELRIAGKAGAHPEWENLTPGEAVHAVNLLREIIRYVYINPSERGRHRLKESKGKKVVTPDDKSS